MLDITKDIRSLSEFKRRTAAYAAELRRTGHPLVLTVNGSAQVVVQDAGAYQRLLELVDRAQAIEGIQRGLESMRRGDGVPAAAVLGELRKKRRPKPRP